MSEVPTAEAKVEETTETTPPCGRVPFAIPERNNDERSTYR
nr:MAG TPA: hypothetical protein [Caudoviricetes sp.]